MEREDWQWGPEKTNRTKNTVKNVDPSKGYFPRPEFMGEQMSLSEPMGGIGKLGKRREGNNGRLTNYQITCRYIS
jgi:hypothetical protein